MSLGRPPRQDRLRLLSIEQVARFLDTTVHALYRMRERGQGPPAHRIGRHLRYRWIDIQRWQQQQQRDGR